MPNVKITAQIPLTKTILRTIFTFYVASYHTDFVPSINRIKKLYAYI